MHDVWRALDMGRTPDEQRRLLYEFLEHDGIDPPALPQKVDISEQGKIINPSHHHYWTVRYTTIDKLGRKIYYFEEREIWHIIPRLLEKGDDAAIPYLSRVPHILQTGQVRPDRYDPDLRLYRSRSKYQFLAGIVGYLEVAVKAGNVDWVLTFYVRLEK